MPRSSRALRNLSPIVAAITKFCQPSRLLPGEYLVTVASQTRVVKRLRRQPTPCIRSTRCWREYILRDTCCQTFAEKLKQNGERSDLVAWNRVNCPCVAFHATRSLRLRVWHSTRPGRCAHRSA